MKRTKLRIGTRGSVLALWQANHVKATLESLHAGLEIELTTIKTTGDKITDVPLAKVGGKGLFVKEIEEALVRREIDLAVHSMKDVPTKLPESLHLAVVTQREDPRDALLSRDGTGFLMLPPGSVVGTSSLRRQAQLRARRPDLKFDSLRGNLDTRMRKLREGKYAAIILAAAGLKRLGLADQVTEFLEPDLSLPAIGQGALGLECRRDDERTNQLLLPLDHPDTHVCVEAERALLERLEGGCQVPIAAYGVLAGADRIRLEGLVVSVDGTRLVRDTVTGLSAEARQIGLALGDRLLCAGADSILKEIYEAG